MEIRLLHGAAIAPYIDDIARLRLTLLREFPYLYEGTPECEADALRSYIDCECSLAILAVDEGRVVGASTGLPLSDKSEALRQPFLEQGRDPRTVYYFGKSVLLPAYRGRGLGVRFFIERESYAHKLGGFHYCAFSAVERPNGHPRRPDDYKPLHGFWRNRGFLHQPSMRASYAWRDLDEADESDKTLSFWLKDLLL
ncbi:MULTISPECIES: GNAT family N-acetyltransferase [Pseudomonas]|uniref:GNAT family acetyltransferase n=1 Tax=Pseudomonas putida TaxID=303 RepID=A0AAD0LC05_PSEPU|nr:GNAT family N-acetyltransferase [Pseudomonas putida]AXA26507.1 GNAT family acetyltransferase [Pseudomonas putida]MBH3461074.1 GNAT family N-acetyltransferase [Pseudomonas putida]HEK1770917.1 GNAT family N-acetyltransferase [Pseudomonas putida]